MTQLYSTVGDANLDVLEDAEHFTEWLFENVRQYLHGTILEIGSGKGTYSKKLIRDYPQHTITLSDIDPRYMAQLEHDFGSSHVNVHSLDFGKREYFEALGRRYDSVFAINVLEHVKEDVQAFHNVYTVLTPGGTLVVLVPAHRILFNCIDEALGHYRRYTKEELRNKAQEAGFLVEQISYFNALSIPGWYLNGTILRRPMVNRRLVNLYDALVPLVRPIEKYLLRNRLGISLIAVLKRPLG